MKSTARNRILTAAVACIAIAAIWWWWPWPNAWPIGIDDGKSVGTEG